VKQITDTKKITSNRMNNTFISSK